MSKSATKPQRVTGGRIAVMIISVLLLSFIMAFGMLLGVSSLKHNKPVVLGEDTTTVRKRLPAEGANPMASSPLDNIGYMAYVMDNQPFYHAHAYNSTKSTGYEQITQTWKDYMTAEVSGEEFDVMVASDLSYSALIKSSTQSCFIGQDEAHVRGGNKPGKNTTPLGIEWAKSQPSIYDKKNYKRSYGEFSTEISVYVINEQTLSSAEEVIDNGDGTYSQKFYLNENCGVWYQYKMKTNGGLKNYPEFKRVEITFTFDENYQIIESYCEERATISPRALGGMNMPSDSKTTTRYDYTQEGFDEQHFAYFKNFYKDYVGTEPGTITDPVVVPTVIEVLGSGFSKVVAPDGSGQQFKLALKIGETDYDGKVFLSLTDMNDVLNTLDARLELEKRGSGRQDLYAEFKKGKINVYYSSNFALTADIDEISTSVNKIIEWINGLTKSDKKSAASFALTEEEQAGGGLDLGSLLNDLKLEMSETEAYIKLNSQNLLGLGVGIDVVLGFDRVIEEDGGSLFSAKSIDLNYINYKGTLINLSANVVPDESAKIERKPSQSTANLAEYVDSVYSILNSKTIKLSLGLEDKLIDGLTLDAAAYMCLGSQIAAKVDVSAEYKGITLKLDASYEIDTTSGDYGNVYLHVSEINGTQVNARVYCNIKDTVQSVKDIIAIFKGSNEGGDSGSDDIVEEAKNELAEIINKVLNLNFEKIVGSLNGNAEQISLEVDIDEILRGLNVSLGVDFGTLSLSIEKADPKIHGYVSSLGVSVDITGSENALVLDKDNYVDVKAYIDGVAALLNSTSYEVTLKLVGTKISDSLNLEGLKVDGTAKIALKDGAIKVALPVCVEYDGYAVNLTAYYTVSLSGGDYGDIYLDIEKMTVATDGEVKEIELGAKVYCDINGAADTINAIISKFAKPDNGNGTDTLITVAEADGSTSVLAKVVETLLKLNYNEILNATNEKLTLNVNVDEILAGLQVSLGGISFGELHLEYVTKTGALSGTLEKLGLSLGIVGSDNEVTLTDGVGFVNLNTYLESVNTLLNRNSYEVKVLFDGNKIADSVLIADMVDLKKLYIDATAKAAVTDGTVLVNIPACVSYDGYALTFSVFYTIDFATGNYGTAYLHVTEFKTPENTQSLDAKVYCDIKNVVDAVNAIIGKFTKPAEGAAYASMPSKGELLTNAISLLLSLDYKEIINATNEQLTVNLNVDEVLAGLGIDLGGISFGTLNLGFVTESGSLSCSLEKLGFEMSVDGSDDVLDFINTDGYVDLGAYVTSVKDLLNKASYDVTVNFDGKDLPADITSKLPEFVDLTTLKLGLQAKIAFTGNNFNGVDVAISNLAVTYENLTIELAIRYSVDFNGTYGTVYISVLSINGDSLTGANVTCNIDEAVASVTRIINLFKGNTPDNGTTYAATSTADIISKVLEIVLKLDFNALIHADADKATVTVDLDSVLQNVISGVTLGMLTLEYEPKTYTLTAADNDLGLSLVRLVGSDEKIASVTGEYIDVNVYIDSIETLINSSTYEVGLHLTGKQITEKIDLTGLKLDATAYVQTANGFSKFDVCVPLTVDYYGVSLSLVANYSIDTKAKNLGTVYLEITNINGTDFAAKVYGDINEVISAVNALLDQFKTNTPDNAGAYASASTNDIISKVIGVVLNLDFANIINATQSRLEVTLNVDDILNAFDFSVAGITFGDLKLIYNTNGTLSGALEKLGVNASVQGNNDYEMPEIISGEYLNVAQLLDLVNGIVAEGKEIAKKQDVAFTVNAKNTVDGSVSEISGYGEVSWKDGLVKVAVSLDVTVDRVDRFALNFIFDETNMYRTCELPVAILAINGDAVKIFVKDTSNLVNSFKHLIEAFTKKSDTTESATAPDTASGYALSVGGYTLEELLKNENIRKALGAIVGLISDFTVDLVDGDIDKLVVKYSDKITVTLCDSGYISFKAETATLTLSASAEAGEGESFVEISADLANEKTDANADGKYTYYDLFDFIELIYNGIFDYIENELTLKDFLGASAYSVDLSLVGANSGIEALEGVTVGAELYYAEGVVGTFRNTKLMHVALNIDISGTKVLASVSYKGQMLYVKIDKIGSTELSNIAFRTDVHNIYAAAEELVRLVTETDLVDTINKFLGKGASLDISDIENLQAYAMQRTAEGEPTSNTLVKLLDAILNLDLEKSFVFNKAEGTATINIDSLSEALLGVKIGTVDIKADKANKTFGGTVAIDGKEPWITLGGVAGEKETDVINPNDYMDIGFASTLISDLVKTLTDNNKHVYDLYTFTGSITIPVSVTGVPLLGSINITIELKNATLTVGLDEKGGFYFTLAASLQKCTYATFVITENRDISVTYSNGYIVLGRDIGTSNEKYKICTLNYLLDTLLDKDNSPARWLLGTSSTVWGILVDQLKLNISSGLTKPQDFVLYNQLAKNEAEGSFNLKKYVSGITVKADGKELTNYNGGATAAIEQFKLKDSSDYYALDINAEELTGGTLTTLCAMLTRTKDGGITGLKAYVALGSMVKVNVDFSTYLEGVRETYGGKVLSPEKADVTSYEQLFGEFIETEDTVTAENYANYFVYDVDAEAIIPASEYIDGATYFERTNTTYYVKNGESYVLATEYDASADYYIMVEGDSTAALGTVAMPNYYNIACTVNKNHTFDPDHDFGENSNHITKIFGCFNTEDGSYEASNVLETVYLDVYSSVDATVPERTVELPYGSTVHLISDFPEFADEEKSKKLTYVKKDGSVLENTIYLEDGKVVFETVEGKLRVSIYKSETPAYKVVFHFVGVDMQPVSAAFNAGDSLVEYHLNDYSFLGWYKEETLTNSVTKVLKADAVDNVIHVYGKYFKTLYKADNGVNYSFDTKLNGGNGGYYVSGVNEKISYYYNNQNEWLKIESNINGYDVYYIAREAFANGKNDTEHSLVNVLVPETVTAVYDRAFLDNKGLKQVAFLADRVFFGGRADSNGKTSVFYGCYVNVSNSVNTSFTVYYNGTRNNPYNHVSTTNNTIDEGGWNRIYFNSGTTSKTVYTMKTQSAGWSYVEFETEVIDKDGNVSALPENVNLSNIIYNGIYFTNYAEAGNLANAITESIASQLNKNIYEADANAALPLDGKAHTVKVTITEHEEVLTATDINITVTFNGNQLYSGVQTVENDAVLKDIYSSVEFDGKSGYSFIGWYTDPAFTKAAPEKNSGRITDLYARIVPTTVTASNGVTYTFSLPDANNNEIHYKVSGFTKLDKANGGDGVDYSSVNSWLVLENELYGLKVTEINSEALSAKKSGICLKNVVVPANIKTIGTRAFLDNYDIRNVVLLANSVTLNGSTDQSVFYGCSISDGGNTTNLNVYYNVTVPSTQWNYFRKSDKYIGVNGAGGSINGAGTWSYVKFTVEGGFNASDFGYNDGLVGMAIDDEYLAGIKAKFISQLNEQTATDNNVIYKYNVVVTDEIVDGIHNITVTVSDNGANHWNVLLDLDSNIQIVKTADIEIVSGKYFAKPNSTVTIKSSSGNLGLKSLTVYENSNMSGVIYEYKERTDDNGKVIVNATLSFTMPARSVYVVATSGKLPITSITVVSAVEAEGFTYNADDGSWIKVYKDVAEGDSLDYTFTAEGHIFVGLAFENVSNKLEFEATVTHPVYYAVWAVHRDEVKDDTIKYIDGKFSGEADAAYANKVYGWYVYEMVNDSPVFNTLVQTMTDLTVETTEIYPRMVFNLSYTMQSSLSGTNHYFVREDTNDGTGDKTQEGGTLTGSVEILENTSLDYLWAYTSKSDLDTDKVLKIEFVNANGEGKWLYFRIKNKAKASITDWNPGWKTKEYDITGAIKNGDVGTEGGEKKSLNVDENKELIFTART